MVRPRLPGHEDVAQCRAGARHLVGQRPGVPASASGGDDVGGGAGQPGQGDQFGAAQGRQGEDRDRAQAQQGEAHGHVLLAVGQLDQDALARVQREGGQARGQPVHAPVQSGVVEPAGG
ncbi:hypothetical protein ABH917_001929 [Thermobifida halotolerans]